MDDIFWNDFFYFLDRETKFIYNIDEILMNWNQKIFYYNKNYLFRTKEEMIEKLMDFLSKEIIQINKENKLSTIMKIHLLSIHIQKNLVLYFIDKLFYYSSYNEKKEKEYSLIYKNLNNFLKKFFQQINLYFKKNNFFYQTLKNILIYFNIIDNKGKMFIFNYIYI